MLERSAAQISEILVTTIACDGRTMAGDGLATDQYDTVMEWTREKVMRLDDGTILGASGNSMDADAWMAWRANGKIGECPVRAEQFSALVLEPSGVLLWVDHKGREVATPPPVAIGSGQDIAIGAMEAGADALRAVLIACKRDVHSGGRCISFSQNCPVPTVRWDRGYESGGR